MKKKNYTSYILTAIITVVGIFLITTYNSLVNKDEKVKLQANEVQNAYQRRLDLIPNLVNVVKGVSDFEQNTLVEITNARSKAMTVNFNTTNKTADEFNKANDAQNSLATATNNLIISIEKYPVLKGSSAYAGLQTQLEGTERRIKIARKDFNEAINVYNSAVRTFPTKLVAGIFGFNEKKGFKADEGAETITEIKF